jgi:hypothetical protein
MRIFDVKLMFERYTEKARRVVFFARYEASQFGSPYIETEHLLLGLLREDKALTQRFLGSHASVGAGTTRGARVNYLSRVQCEHLFRNTNILELSS